MAHLLNICLICQLYNIKLLSFVFSKINVYYIVANSSIYSKDELLSSLHLRIKLWKN